MNYGVIMAGGSGTRLWPLSRNMLPKQLLPVIKGKSLLQLSFERVRALLPAERIFVCTGEAYRDLVLHNLPELPPENLLGEPIGRDTANAVGFTAAVLHKLDKDATAAFVTADHVIEPVENFAKALQTAFDVTAAKPNALVTFGILPTYGHTGLGYIHKGQHLSTKSGSASIVQAFKEKPDKPTADRYVESGRYYWNSGMFVWRCDTVLADLATFLPENSKAWDEIAAAWGTPAQQETLSRVYPNLKKISIDYALMEPPSQKKGKSEVVVVEMPVQWLDVGAWPALAETLETDSHNNAVSAKSTVLIDSDDNVIISQDPNHLISTINVSDLIIVHTPDATLVCPKNEAQRVKEIVMKLKEKFGEKYQ
jgi:mannose-1-phosphate guanylyltransferase